MRIELLKGPRVDGQQQAPDPLLAKINEVIIAVNLLLEQAPQATLPVQTLHGQGNGDPESISENSKER